MLSPYILSALISRIPSREGMVSYEEEHASTEATLQTTLADLSIILHFLPSRPPLASLDLPMPSIIRLVVAGYIVYAALVLTTPPSLIIAIIGTFVLTWRAPWARTTRSIVISNAWIRYFSKRAWEGLIGMPSTTPHPDPITAPRSVFGADSPGIKSSRTEIDPSLQTDIPPPSHMRFRFTVVENQRWWVGLDWTAALLPHERASWTSAPPAFKPVPAPMTVSLPPTSSIYLPLNVKGKVGLTAQ